MKTTRQLAQTIERGVVAAAGAIRRMPITRAVKAIWQLTGFSLPDDDGGKTVETANAEVFSGIGFYARPAASGRPEAIVVNVLDAEHPIAIAIRDEKTRQASAAHLGEDESAVFNTVAILHVRSDGTVHVASIGNDGQPLPTMADFQALRDYVNDQFSTAAGHTHVVVGGATTTIATVAAPGTAPTVPAPQPAGTDVLRGE